MKSRRSFLRKSGLLLATTPWLNASLAQTHSTEVKPLPELKGRKVLFIYGGWKGHEPEKFRDYLVPWMKEEGATVHVFDNLTPYSDEVLMKDIDLIVQTHTMSTINEEQEKGLLKAVKQGAGMAGWHGGMCDAFRQNVNYQYMTGGQWVAHPGGIIDYTVNIIDNDDTITHDLKDFDMTSEQYYMHVDPNVKVLATTQFDAQHDDWIEGCTMPVCWKKMYGKGRIFYTSLGHNLSHVTEVPEAIKLIKRGIRWASASKYDGPEKWVSPVYKTSV
ncbi:ThuA domain-containing protein [Fulvivirga sp. M361]|uniref:ThuA domain-containing protein n=1 Tax=Fulvivirga sp. M361 TaxID=2594266 RepID=UPI00117AD0B2|nr:ThuA domain-containing protein [Fulvivirga sp. M361]TRX48591.1 ThuA domain-containing protein [Fulvivirga sp. M361]